MTPSVAARLLSLSAVVLSISACGGGGGGGGDKPPASLSVSPSELTFSATSGSSAPAPQTLRGTISGTVEGDLFITITLNTNIVTVPGVVITSTISGEAQVYPASPATLGPGAHTGTITLRACTNNASCTSGNLSGSPRTIPVTYTVNGLRVTGSLAYLLNDASSSADLTKQIQLQGYPSTATWTVTSDAPWLTVPSAGSLNNGSGQFTATIDQAQVEALVNDSYTGTLTLVPQMGSSTSIPITLNVDRSEVSYVSPYVAVAGTSREVVIRGAHLPANPSVSFGGAPASNVIRVSDSEIRATYPATLAVGRHAVQVNGVNRSRAELAVATVPAYAAERLGYATDLRPKRIIYDAERQALLVVLASSNSANNEFARFSYASGSWGAVERHTTFNLTDMVLSADGTEWLGSLYSPISVRHYNAGDLSFRGATADASYPSSAYFAYLAVANDGYAIMSGRSGSACGTVSRYRPRAPKFIRFASGVHACSPFLGASADGSIIIAGNNIDDGIERYVASTGELSALSPDLGLQLTAAPVLDRHANRIVLNKRRVYGANFSLLGELPADTKAVVLSPDGAIAWTYVASGHVRKFDLLATPVGGLFLELGSPTPLAASPDANNDQEVVMASTPEAEVLFIAGDDGVVVQPAP
jgi:hypothetical protein